MHCDNHLDTLGVDLLALLVPVDDRFGTATGLTNKRSHAPRHADLVRWNLGELRGSCEADGQRGSRLEMRDDKRTAETLTPRGDHGYAITSGALPAGHTSFCGQWLVRPTCARMAVNCAYFLGIV